MHPGSDEPTDVPVALHSEIAALLAGSPRPIREYRVSRLDFGLKSVLVRYVEYHRGFVGQEPHEVFVYVEAPERGWVMVHRQELTS